MPSIVLNDYLRSTIRFNKAATVEANRLSQLNTTGQIDRKDSNNIPHAMNADRLQSEISELEFEISKADKAFNTIETSMMAIDQMRIMVDKIADLEKAAATETDTALSAAYTDQISELKDQMVSLGESASYQGTNLFSGWGTENMTIGGQNFQLQQVDFNDVVSGFAYRGGNVLGIENGDFDTSAYENLVAAYGPDTINNTYTDFTGNYPDGSMLNGAYITSSGPSGSYGVDFPTAATSYAGSYVDLPDLTLPVDFTMSVWAKLDETDGWARVFEFSGPGNNVLLARYSGTDEMVFGIVSSGGGLSKKVFSGSGAITNGDWAHWTVSAQQVASIPSALPDGSAPDGTVGAAGTHMKLYKDGDLVSEDYVDATLVSMTRTNNFFGASSSGANPTTDGAIADFTIFDGVMSEDDVELWYEDVASVGLENKFFSMDSEALTDALDKIEGHLTGAQIGIEATRNQMAIKSELYAEETTNLLSIDTEEVALQTNLAQTRQTLAMTSLSISSQSHSNILNLFN